MSALKIYLSGQDYKLYEAYTGAQALEVVRMHDIQLILMDIMMPEMDGIAATARLREQSNIPVILLTAKSEATDKVLGLNIGADDYITKPFEPMEVLARVRSQLRRYTNLGGQAKKPSTLRIGGIELCDDDKTVAVDGEPAALTPIEYNILKLLMQSPGRSIPRRRSMSRCERKAVARKKPSASTSHPAREARDNPSAPATSRSSGPRVQMEKRAK